MKFAEIFGEHATKETVIAEGEHLLTEKDRYKLALERLASGNFNCCEQAEAIAHEALKQ